MEPVLAYFKEAEKLLNLDDFETTDDLNTFMQNVFTEVDGMEKRMSCHHDGSRILERFIGLASSFQLRVFFERITGEMAKLATHRYASHVMEALLKRSEAVLLASPGYVDEEHEGLAGLPEMIVRLSNEIGEAFELVLCNSWGSHVYRRMIGILVSGLKRQKIFATELDNILENVAQSETKFLRDLAFDQFASPALQAILEASSQRGKSGSILEKVFGDLDTNDSKSFVLRAANNEYASHLVEVAIKSFQSAEFLAFYNKAVHPEFSKIIQGTPSNFLIQHIITACHSEAQLKVVLADIDPFLEGLIENRRAGLLVRLLQWSLDHKRAAEDLVLQALFKAFQCKSTAEKKHIFDRVIRLQSGTDLDLTAPITPLGCSILSAVAGLNPDLIKPFIDNILDLTAEDLVKMACHHTASRTLETFISHGTLSDKALSRLIRRLQGQFGLLASNKSASHVVERLWGASKTDLKSLIMAELAASKKRLEDSAHGRLVLRNCRVAEFERRQEDWVKEEAAAERKRTYFADLLEDGGEGQQEQSTKPAKKSEKSKKKKKSGEDSFLLTEDL